MKPKVELEGRVTTGTSTRLPGGVPIPDGPPLVIDLRGHPDGLVGAVPAGWPEPLDRLVKALLRAVSLADVAAAVVAYGTAAVGARCARVVLFDRH
ncbi:MAG: hypothetical protein ACRD0O_19355, partial [Acidimicrobiia bacterium]